MGLVVAPVALRVVVVAATLGGQNRIETLGIEIEQVDLMTGLRKSGQGLFSDRGVKAVVERMAIDIQHAHRQGLELTKLRILPGFSRPCGSTSCLKPS